MGMAVWFMIFCLSASYKKAKLPLLESLVFKDGDAVMKSMCSEGLMDECVLVQTCHRVEIYGVMKDSSGKEAFGKVMKFWSANTGVSLDILARNVGLLKGRDALANLFNLASGLDSMVVGEDQILGQVRKFYVKAKQLGCVGLVLEKVFMRAINVGRRVRSETRVNEGSVSISSAAVDLAAKELGDLRRRTALVVGAGEAGSVAAETLRRRGVRQILVANRTYETGVQLAKKVRGKPVRFEEIYDAIPRTDLTIVALTVDRPVVKASRLRKAFSGPRVDGGLFLVDISQPRAVEEDVGSIDGVVLRNIDSLKEVVEESIRSRDAEAEKARRIVSEELERFEKQQFEFLIQPLISEIYKRVDGIRQKELKRVLSKMAESDEKKVGILDRFSRELVERILQAPIDQLREAALNNDDGLLSAAEKLFKVK
jgi:glutamyl-tRNA reductase